MEEELGFNGDQVVNIRYRIKDTNQRNRIYQKVETDFKKIEGVEGVVNHGLRIGQTFASETGVVIEGKTVYSINAPVGYDFLQVFDAQLAEGRFFDRTLSSDSINKVVINEAYKRAFNLPDGVVGKKMKWNGSDYEIIGVVKDLKMQGFSKLAYPTTYFLPHTIAWFTRLTSNIAVKIKANNVQQTLGDLESFWEKRIENTYPMDYQFVNEDFALSYQKTLYQRTLFLCLMGVSIFIALFGLMAVVSFSIESRLKEIAIRKVLGANTRELVINLSGRFLLYGTLGFFISIFPVYYLIQLWLADFAYRIAISIWPFLFAFVGLIIFSMLLVVGKAIRATRINTLKCINYE